MGKGGEEKKNGGSTRFSRVLQRPIAPEAAKLLFVVLLISNFRVAASGAHCCSKACIHRFAASARTEYALYRKSRSKKAAKSANARGGQRCLPTAEKTDPSSSSPRKIDPSFFSDDLEKETLSPPHARCFRRRISFVQLMTATKQNVSSCPNRNQRLEGRGEGGRGLGRGQAQSKEIFGFSSLGFFLG